MTLKKILFIFVSTILVLSSCDKTTDVSDAIPADAKYVLYVNNKSLIDKSEYDVFQNQTVQRGINMAKAFMKDEEQIKLLDSFLKDANSLGINLKNDFYMYTNYKVYGVVLGINDAKKVKKVLLKSSLIKEENLKEEKGIYSVSPETGACLAWDGNKIILLIDLAKSRITKKSESIDVIAMAKEQLAQGVDKSINSNKEYQEFWKNRKDISVFYRMKGIDELLVMDETSKQLNIDSKTYLKDIQGLSFGSYVSFEKGEIISTNKIFCDTPETEKKIKDIATQISGNLTGDHLKYIAKEPLFAASVNIKGAGIESYMKNLGVLDEISNKMDSIDAITFDQVLKNVNGDITVAVNSLEIETVISEYSGLERQQPVPQCFLLADVKDPSYILNLIKEKMQDSPQKITEINPSVLSISVDSYTVYFGVINNTFFFTNIASIYKDLGSTNLTNNYTKLIQGKSAIVLGDLQVLKTLVERNDETLQLSSKDLAVFQAFTNTFTKYQLSLSTETLEGEGKIELVNKNENSLKAICKSIDEQINALASSFF